MKDRAAVALGRKGGRATSEAKARAARENGKRGGRPKLTARQVHPTSVNESESTHSRSETGELPEDA
jgi:hypothetical protein